jgi:adenosylcobinamide kinase/adenosylcobinamide-phosphate guanylyltransferase
MSPRVVLIGGGVRSGKSAFALAYARTLGARRSFIATAQAYDAEMRARIDAHVCERGNEFSTLEVPLELSASLRAQRDCDVVVVDCLTLWLSNWLVQGASAETIHAQIAELRDTLRTPPCHVLLVSNEVGMGIVPESALGRAFRDLAGRTHQELGRVAHEIYFAMLGQLLRIKPEPIGRAPTF